MATKIVVAGDLSVDWYYWPKSSDSNKEDLDWKLYEGIEINPQPGGAVLLAEWLRKILQTGAEDVPYILASQSCEKLVKKSANEVVHTNIYLDLFPPFSSNYKPIEDESAKNNIYRVRNYIGHIAPDYKKNSLLSLGINNDIQDADIVLIYDSGNFFRNEELVWPEALKTDNNFQKPIIIYSMYPPFFRGKLWDHIIKFHNDRLILILNVDDLRKTGTNISRSISWEKSALDFLWEVSNKKDLEDIKELSNVVTRFNYEGAILYKGKKEKSKLYFDPSSIEGEFWNYKRFGNMRATSLVFIANLSSALISRFQKNKGDFRRNNSKYLKADQEENSQNSLQEPLIKDNLIKEIMKEGLEEGIKLGLIKSREFLIKGYGNTNGKPDFFEYACLADKEINPGVSDSNKFCTLNRESNLIDKNSPSSQSSKSASKNITGTLLPSPEEIAQYADPRQPASKFWTILEEKTKEKTETEPEEKTEERLNKEFESDSRYLESLAFLIVKKGLSSVKDFPVGRFGKLTTVDRAEIESFRSIKNIMQEYIYSEKNQKPLSIAVFGAPGSGKSFGITEIAGSIDKERIRKVTFNISQFTSTKDLANAFHKIRDVSLEGKVPLVFFDEFDSKFESEELGWIKYFLVPMQDGEFLDFESMHPIGRAIFVFAGSTYSSFKDFYDFCNSSNIQSSSFSGLDSCRIISNKCPDFLSRLRGFVNILGLNRASEEDETYIIRRAIQLRSLIEASAPNILSGNSANISCGLLNALINVPEYMHGVRSMLAILEMSVLHERNSWQTAYLPPKDQLELHIKSIDEFYKLLAEKKQSCLKIR
jgi:DNA replication protein DnaC